MKIKREADLCGPLNAHKKMANHNSPSQPEEDRPKKRPRIPFQHKISVKPTDLGEQKAPENSYPEADLPEDDFTGLMGLDLDPEASDPYFKTSDFDDEDSQDYGPERGDPADRDDFEDREELDSEDLPDETEEDPFAFDESEDSEGNDLY